MDPTINPLPPEFTDGIMAAAEHAVILAAAVALIICTSWVVAKLVFKFSGGGDVGGGGFKKGSIDEHNYYADRYDDWKKSR